MLSSAGRRNVSDRPLDDFEQRLLDSFSADIARDRAVFAAPRYLIEDVQRDPCELRGHAVDGTDRTDDDGLVLGY